MLLVSLGRPLSPVDGGDATTGGGAKSSLEARKIGNLNAKTRYYVMVRLRAVSQGVPPDAPTGHPQGGGSSKNRMDIPHEREERRLRLKGFLGKAFSFGVSTLNSLTYLRLREQER